MSISRDDFPPEESVPVDPVEDLEILDDQDPLDLDEIEIEDAKEQHENYQQE